MAIGGRVDPLQIIGPPGIQEWLENTLKLTYAHLPYVIQYIIFNSTSSQIYEDEYVTIDTIPLNHRVPACGFLITEKIFRPNIDVNKIVKFGLVREQIKALVRGEQTVTNDGNILTLEDISLPNRRRRAYAYVSDSAYSEEVIHNLSGRVTTLYHESTYIDVDNASAIKWGHSTALQAAAVARESGAEKLVLGHFSGKYESLDIFHREAASVFPNVTLAYPGLMLEV
jgi:ribonuclease Z